MKNVNTKMLLRSILAIVMVAAMLLCCVACKPADDSGNGGNGGGNKENNVNKYEGMTDAEYVQALTLDHLEGAVDGLSAGVGVYADLIGSTPDDFSGTADITLMLGDMLIDLAEQAIFGTAESGMDMSFLSNIGLDMEIDSTSELAQLQVALGLSDTEIVALSLLMNEETVWAGAPALTDKFLEVSLADMGVDIDGATSATPSWMSALPSVIPSEEKLAEILNRYIAMALKEIDKVERTTETLTLEGLSQEVTKLDVKIYEQDALDVCKAVLNAAKTDADIKGIVENFGKFYNDMMEESYGGYDVEWQDMDFYAEFTAGIDSALAELPAEAETTDSYIGLILYVDGGHNIVGCSLDMGLIYSQTAQAPAQDLIVTTSAGTADTSAEPESNTREPFIVFTYYTITEGNKFATVLETAEDTLKITGKGTIENGVTTGTYSITAEGMTFVTVDLKDFSATDDAVKGTVTLKPTEDLMNYVFNGPNPYGIDDIALKMTLDITGDKADVAVKLIGDDAMIVGIALKLAEKTPAAIEKPTNVIQLTGQQSVMDLVSGMDFSSVFANLRTAGVPEELVTALESLVPAV